MKKIESSRYRVDSPVTLADTPTKDALLADDDTLKKELNDIREEVAKFQDRMYAHGKYSVLICLQGMDTAGKDSLIRQVFKDFNSRGIVVHSFKTPSDKEKKHDFLWRHTLALPERGKFAVFNRTHYENVLVTRVHPQYILGENLPGIDSVEDVNEAFWHRRFEQILDYERRLHENGMIIFKFYLHLSRKEQRDRLLARIEEADKNWKFSPGDVKERGYWGVYQKYYEDAINRTSTPHAPWYVIPADNKKAARVIVASVLRDVLARYTDVREPSLPAEIQRELEAFREQLRNE